MVVASRLRAREVRPRTNETSARAPRDDEVMTAREVERSKEGLFGES